MNYRTLFGISALLLAAFAGCARSTDSAAEKAAEQLSADHDHSGWWCSEHGVPEGVCTRCKVSLAADFKSKGDWCKDHDRPDSQCFVCHPEREADFAAQYEAKYGKKPPKPEAEEESRDPQERPTNS